MNGRECIVAGIETSKLTAGSFDQLPLTVGRPTHDRHTARSTTLATRALDAWVLGVRSEQSTFRHPTTLTVSTAV